MEKIITLEDGRMFLLNTTEILTPEYESSIIDQLNSKISKLAAGCGIIIPKGTTKNIRCTASSGTGRYLYELYMNNVKVDQSPAGSGGSYTFSYTFNTVGTINVSIKVTDDCSTPSTCGDSNCTVTVTEATSTLSLITLTGCAAQPKQIGDTCTLTETCKDSSGAIIACPTLSYVSSNPSVVSVTPVTGKCTAIANGTAIITASKDGIVSNPINFTVGSTAGKPILTSISPTTFIAPGPYTITVIGSNFDSGVNGEAYKLDGSLAGSSANHPETVRTSTSISWSGNLDLSSVGTYKMKVKNGDCQYADNIITYTITEEITCQTPVCNFTIE